MAVTKLPKKTFRGCAKGLSGNPNSKTIYDPNEPARNNPMVLLKVKIVKTPIVKAEKNPATRAFLKIYLLYLIIDSFRNSS